MTYKQAILIIVESVNAIDEHDLIMRVMRYLQPTVFEYDHFIAFLKELAKENKLILVPYRRGDEEIRHVVFQKDVTIYSRYSQG